MYPGKINNMKALAAEVSRLDAERDYLEYELRRLLAFYKKDYKALARSAVAPVLEQYYNLSRGWKILRWLIRLGWRTGWLKYFLQKVFKKVITYILQFAGIKLLINTLKKGRLRKRALSPQPVRYHYPAIE
ncbi:hypothetical protein KTO58_23425 [Chitinophaga pendula]|uniref:hypothetical protein n=1 Tax=Chitinophaga TaxID=79328 RepID=UPI000BB012EC|nr:MULTISPECIES: hypothetical protein [Chitinophaga]ASZ10441.1 hypothetical protein CK934_05340 [Chitinophaga sp. MD30]UCJ06590.1 hypothetical protein KTO58_23425 [Chitinophaga pendula]